jgi:sterol desaturase/sphingolipid hydroxylase (fatty acid hydroxylase superfamily)
MKEGGGTIMILLLGTLLFAAVVTFVRAGQGQWSFRALFRHILPSGTLTHPSARADFLFWLSKRFIMPPLVLVLGVSTVAAGHLVYAFLGHVIAHPPHTDHAGAPTLLLFTLSMLITYDFACYSYHFLQHRIPLMWEFHKVHHSAELLVGVTKDRVHPVDEILSRAWTGAISGSIYAVWLYFVLDPAELLIFGMDAYALINTVIMMDFVRHTHMKLSYGRWLNAVFLCPHFHQLHHSINPQHYDRNFGQVLSVWDRLFGTLKLPKKDEDFKFGLMYSEHDEYQSLPRLYWVPFIKAARLVRRGDPLRFPGSAEAHTAGLP